MAKLLENTIINYCFVCGQPLKKKQVDQGFDINTGQPTYNLIWKCSQWKFFQWPRHTKFKSDKHGSTYAFES